MKKVAGTVISMSDDSLYTQFICVGDDGTHDRAVSSTLCRAVGGLLGPEIDDFLGMLDAAGRGDLPACAINCAASRTHRASVATVPELIQGCEAALRRVIAPSASRPTANMA